MARHLRRDSVVGPDEAVCPDLAEHAERQGEVPTMSLTTGSRRASQFAALLDSPQRSDDPALAPYVALAGALSALPVNAGPSPDFRAALRQRLVAVATVQPAGQPEDAATRLRGAAGAGEKQRPVAGPPGGAAPGTPIARGRGGA